MIYDDAFLKHRPPDFHYENPNRVQKIVSHLRETGLLDRLLVKPRAASVEEVCLVHDRKYVEIVLKMCERGGMYIDGDTYVSPGSKDAALMAVGAVLTGVDLILRGEIKVFYAPVRPPGHHAGIAGRALTAPTQGFCIFNNVAIGAEYAIRKGVKKVAIVDIDAHHGNGTQEIFYTRSDVLYISIHQDPYTLYPGTGFVHEVGEGEGEGFNVNIPLPPGAGDDIYEQVLEEIIQPVLRQYRPDIVLVSLGFDAHAADPLTELEATLNTYEALFRLLVGEAEKGTFRGVGFVLEGGYVGEILAKGSEILLKIALGQQYTVDEKKTTTRSSVIAQARSRLREIRQIQSRYWNLS